MQDSIDKYLDEHYKNKKRGRNVSINKDLWIDFQQVCLNLSRKSYNRITASYQIRRLMAEFIIRNTKI